MMMMAVTAAEGHMGLPGRHGKILDLSRFDAQFFHTNPKQAHVMDPQLRMLLETSYEAIFDAGYDPDTLRKRSIGVFIANSNSESYYAFRKDDKVDSNYLLGCARSMFSNRISYSLDLQGSSMTVDTACSSTLVALNEAMLALRSGRCEAAIVGAGNLNLDPCVALNFKQMGVLSEDGKCKSFDSSGDGYVRSEIIGCMFLQKISDARLVYTKVINVNVNTDGYKLEGMPFPSAVTHEQLLRATYAEADVDPRRVVYVEAHGIASMAKVILTMETGTIAANLHFKEPSPDIPSLHDGRLVVVDRPMPFDGGLVAISLQGIGGTNAHGIFEPHQGPHVDRLQREKPEIPRLVLLAGRTKESMLRTLDRIEAEGPYPDPTYALLNRVGQPSTRQFPCRAFAIVPVDDSAREIVKAVQDVPSEKRPLWFVFTGLGCQWYEMASQMMQFDIFARSIHQSHAMLRDKFGIDLIDLVTSADPRNKSIVSFVVAITTVQVALVDMLHAIGLKPDGIVGHSLGEVGCSYADGGLNAEQAVLSAYWRGRCTELKNPPKGSMAAVGKRLTWDEVTKRCPPGVYPACHNAEDSVTVSGPTEAVAEMVAQLKAENIFARNVDSLDVAFHSKHVEHIGPSLLEELNKAANLRLSARSTQGNVCTADVDGGAARGDSQEVFARCVGSGEYSPGLQTVSHAFFSVRRVPSLGARRTSLTAPRARCERSPFVAPLRTHGRRAVRCPSAWPSYADPSPFEANASAFALARATGPLCPGVSVDHLYRGDVLVAPLCSTLCPWRG
ncbi:hypothetical protein HPB51_009400 [Rhipicephalus microplus]|uniref:Fatty acid synthase n=1 Tax=Rhipicephalus microplus TaxID=6941 RepID=A0A9J6ESN8_RHIMP|nr:hypothetical protein HPB51_009400 [Rhipicephalus microplus]